MKHRQVIAAMLAAGLFGAFSCAAMADAPAIPAPSSVLCQTLHQAAQPTLVGLMKNDGLLEQASRAFIVTNGDRLSLRSVIEGLAQNLTIINRLLGQKFPPDGNPTASASEDLMKTRLQAVATAQNDALNMIEAYVESQDMQVQNSPELNADRRTPADFRSIKDPSKPAVDTHLGSPGRMLDEARSQIGELEDRAGVAVMSAVDVCNSPHAPPH